MKRRNFLRGMGGIAVALPTLSIFRSASAQAGGAHPTKMVVMAYPMGTHTPYFQPNGTGRSFTLNPISNALEGFQDRCLFLSHFDNAIHDLVQAHRFGHPGKEATTLTGTLTQDAFGGSGRRVEDVIESGGADGAAAGPSIEEVVGRYLRRDGQQTAVSLGISGGRASWDQRDTFDSSFFFEGAGTPTTLTTSVSAAFNGLFADLDDDGGMVDPAIAHLHARNRSVLDAVRAGFVDLRQGLGPADRALLDDHMDRIRTLEGEVMRTATCQQPDGDYGGADWSMPTVAPLQNRIAAMALACGMSPVARIEFAAQQNPVFNLPDLEAMASGADTDWHGIVHMTGDTTPARIAGFRFFVEMYADLLTQLEALEDPTGEGSLLDNTLTLLASNFGPGNGHSAKKMCMVMAGNLGDAQAGYHFDASPGGGDEGRFYQDGTHNVNHIHNSILRMVGVTDDAGAPVTTHGLPGFADGQVIDEIFG